MTDEVSQVSRLEALYADDKPNAAEATATATSQQQGAGDKGEVQQSAEKTPTGSEAAAAEASAKQGEPPAPENDEADIPEDAKGLKAALVATRKKHREQMAALRTELEKKVADVGKRVDKPVARQQQQRPARRDPIVDPDGYAEDLATESFVALCEGSREDMVDEVGADEMAAKEAAFEQAVAADANLAARLRRSRDPARFAYTQGKKFLEAQQSKPDGDEAAYAKFKARFAEEFDLVPKQKAAADGGAPQQQAQAGKPSSQPKPQPRLPTSLADVQSGSPRSNAAAGDAPLGRRPLKDLYGD